MRKVVIAATTKPVDSIRQMQSWLSRNHNGLKIISANSFGGGNRGHSRWFVEWSDGFTEHVETDGTDGGGSKAYNRTKAIEKAVIKRYKELS